MVATYSSSGVGVTRLVLRRTPPPPALVSRVLCCDILLLLRRWCHASCVETYSSSSGVGVTRLVLRHIPPPPALVSRVLCCDILLLQRWFHASGVATYSFSHVKSTRLSPLVGNPWHGTQSIQNRHGEKYPPSTPASHCKRKQRVSGAEAVRMQSRSSTRPLPFHTGSVCSARLNSVFCTEWANSNLILNTIGLDLLLE